MNWFNKENLKDLLKASKKDNNPIVKTALKEGEIPTEYDWKNQMGDYILFGDVNRYVMDSYTVKLFLSKTIDDITISLQTNHSYLGTNQYCCFWKYSFEEENKAIASYKNMGEKIKEIIKDFISNKKPTSLFYPSVREAVQTFDDRNLVRTNIPVINYSYDIDYSKDWDQNIYGLRYPGYKEKSFKEYLNSSIYSNDEHAPSGKFAL